jgi:hypothetical protein
LIKGLSLTLLLSLFYYGNNAQDWSLLSQQKLESPVRVCSIDRLGNIYLSDRGGNIRKLDPEGNNMAQFASTQYGQLTSLESWATLRIFLFYNDLQQYGFLDRFLNPSELLAVPPDLFGMVILATPSSDNQLWLLDSRPFNLSKFDFNFNVTTVQQSLSQLSDTTNLNPYHMIEYQNRVYLGVSNLGILVFDNLGNYLHTLSKPGSSLFYPWRESLYYLSQNRLHLLSVYQNNDRVLELPDNNDEYKHALMSENRVVLLSEKQIFIYRHKPL